MYYLQSRYYDPALGRFINADTCATTDPDGFLSCNMFSYCENDPVNRRDITGFFPQVVLGAFVGALWGIADACVAAALSGEDIGNAALEGALTGAIQGALIAGAGPLAAMIWSGISTTLIDYGLQALAGTNVNHVNAAANGVCSFIGSSVSIGANYLLRNSGGIMGRTVVRLTENLFNTTMQTGVIGYCKDSNFSNTAVTQNPPPVSKPGGNNKRVAFGPVPTTV